MKNPIKTFQANHKGRDFVIGDLHGAYSVFENLLDNLKFDRSVDRMFSVGDLIDRGPENLKCLELIKEPWFHSVLSNHEKMMIDFFNGGPSGHFWRNNGGNWALEAQLAHINKIPVSDLSEVALKIMYASSLVEDLPFLITVDLISGKKIHILHAELPYGKIVPGGKELAPITDADLADPEILRALATRESVEGDWILWSRRIFQRLAKIKLTKESALEYFKYPPQTPFNESLSHIISGHTVLCQPVTFLGQTNIDTGVVNSYEPVYNGYSGLTCIELNTWKFYLTTPNSFKEISPIEIKREEIC